MDAKGGYGLVRLLNHTPYNPIKTGLVLTTMEQYFHRWGSDQE